MKILVVIQGAYGERIVDNIRKCAPDDWQIESFELTKNLPSIIDEPEDFLPKDLPQSDLVIFLSETTPAPQLIPDIASMTGAKGVIAPIDHASWMPLGLKNQIKRSLEEVGVGSAFPKNFCTLTRSTYGYGHSTEPYESEIISEFAEHFGRPKFSVEINPETKVIENIMVERCSPCGSTHHAVSKTIGKTVDDALPEAGLICMHYPCLASMQMEHIDVGHYNTLMHLSGQIFNEQLEPHLKPFMSDNTNASDQE